MVNDDVLEKFYEAEIAAADLRIQHLVRTVNELERAGRYRDANRSRELLSLLANAQDLRRLRQRSVRATMLLKP
jgi:hypothetical protein